MTEHEMRNLIGLFCEDENNFIFSYWDERTADKKLLCASHDEAVVLRYASTSPLSTDLQRQSALNTLEDLEAEAKQDAAPEHNDGGAQSASMNSGPRRGRQYQTRHRSHF